MQDSSNRVRDIASKLSSLLWSFQAHHQLLENVPKDCIENYIDTLETLRASLNHTELTNLINLSPNSIQQWFICSSDMMEEIFELLNDWQRRGALGLYLQKDSDSRKLIDEKFQCLERNEQILESVLKTTDKNSQRQVLAKDLIDVRRFLPVTHQSQGLEFWLQNFGSSLYSVDFQEFKNKLNNKYPGLSERTWIQLKSSLDSNNQNIVTISKWSSFLEGFGYDIGNAINQLGDTLGEEFFAGFLTYDESVAVLKSCSPGSFLIRFSTSQPCGLILAYRTDPPPTVVDDTNNNNAYSDDVIQCLITSKRGRFEIDGQSYSSLRDIVSSKQNQCKVPAPVVKSVARAKFFRGFLSKEETVRLLMDEVSGTFLFRFSSEPGTLVVGYKVGQEVRQTRIYAEPEKGGYRLGTTIYPRIEDIVRMNPTRLKYPYRGISSDSSLLPVIENNSRLYDRYGGITNESPPPVPESTYGVVDALL